MLSVNLSKSSPSTEIIVYRKKSFVKRISSNSYIEIYKILAYNKKENKRRGKYMNNHIVLEPAWKIREIARKSLAGYWKPMFLAVLIYYLLTEGIAMLLSRMFYYDPSVLYMDMGIPEAAFGRLPNLGYGGGIYDFIVGGAFLLGLYTLLLTFFRTKKVDNALVFEGFSHFGKAFLLQLLVTVKTFLWGLLFVIPGIIASYRYSQAFYILADHPEYSVTQCIEESKRLMRGNKGRLFYLQLTFIGWALLASLPSGILAGMAAGGVLGALVAAIPTLFVYVYIYTANTAFYELLTERLVVVMPETGYEHTVEASYTVTEEPETTEADEE